MESYGIEVDVVAVEHPPSPFMSLGGCQVRSPFHGRTTGHHGGSSGEHRQARVDASSGCSRSFAAFAGGLDMFGLGVYQFFEVL